MDNPSINSIQKSWKNPEQIQISSSPLSTSDHLNCPDRGKICRKLWLCKTFCDRLLHIKEANKNKTQFNKVEDVSSESSMVETSATVKKQVNQIYSVLQKRIIYVTNYDSDYDYPDENCGAAHKNVNNFEKSRTSQNASAIRKHRN